MDREEFERWLSEKEGLKLNDTTDKWAKEARKELRKDEESLARRRKEAAVIYDASGNYLFTKRGGETEIRFTKAEARRMEGGIVTHNHPSNASFSMADWKTFKNANLSEIRVAANDGTYYLRRKTKGAEWGVSDEELEKEYKKIRRDVKSKYQEMYKRGMINKTERFILSSDEYNRLFAEKNGFEYGKEMYDE